MIRDPLSLDIVPPGRDELEIRAAAFRVQRTEFEDWALLFPQLSRERTNLQEAGHEAHMAARALDAVIMALDEARAAG